MLLRVTLRKWPCEGVSFAIVLTITSEVITAVLKITFNDC